MTLVAPAAFSVVVRAILMELVCNDGLSRCSGCMFKQSTRAAAQVVTNEESFLQYCATQRSNFVFLYSLLGSPVGLADDSIRLR